MRTANHSISLTNTHIPLNCLKIVDSFMSDNNNTLTCFHWQTEERRLYMRSIFKIAHHYKPYFQQMTKQQKLTFNNF